eukprot:1238155-Rhodomonas_salina.1
MSQVLTAASNTVRAELAPVSSSLQARSSNLVVTLHSVSLGSAKLSSLVCAVRALLCKWSTADLCAS